MIEALMPSVRSGISCLFLLLLLSELHSFPERNLLKLCRIVRYFAWYLAWVHSHLAD